MDKLTNSKSNSRLLRDLQKIENTEEDGIYASPEGDDLYNWEACIFGPEASSWEGGIFKLSLKFPEDYPSKPPKVSFKSKMFHPNSKKYNIFSIKLYKLNNILNII